MKEAKEFMLLFRYEPTNEIPTQAQLNEMQQHWGQFIGNIAMQGRLVSTHQLGFEGCQIRADQTTAPQVHVAEGLVVAGNLVLKAESLEVATNLATKCPILFMGGMVEVRETIPMN